MSVENVELVEKWESFYRRYYKNRIGQLAQKYPDERSLFVDFSDIFQYDPDLADDLVTRPQEMLEYAEEALRQFDLPVAERLGNAHVRIYNLTDKTEIRQIRSHHVNNLIAVEGIVRKSTGVRPKVLEAAFECQRCGTLTHVSQKGGEFRDPYECSGCDRKGPFSLVYEQSNFVDSQTLRIQESPEGLRGGQTPENIDVHIEDDITGEVTPGDRVTVTGILRAKQDTDSTTFDIYMEGINVEIEDQEFEDYEILEEDIEAIQKIAESPNLYDKMVDSIAPSIYGFETEKLAMVLQLFSGVTKDLPDETRIRGDIHILLVGDPGTAKSQLLQYIQKISPRGIYTSGKGSSAAGLTAAAVRDDFADQKWTLEAGALVLADKGIACVDEVDKMDSKDRSAMHEALEQQQVSISKAGINATLKSRCALLGAANPKYGRFDQYEPIAEQIDLEPALISRFDLIFTITDEPDEEEDTRLAEHIIETNYWGEVYASDGQTEDGVEEISSDIDPDLLRKYIAYARRQCIPQMTTEARKHLVDFYVDLRSMGEGDHAIPVTARKLEALVRLAEASARVRLSDKVEEEDSERAIRIVRRSLEEVGYDPETGEFDADIIETGTSKSQRERMKSLKEIIRSVSQEHDGKAPVEDVLDMAEENGMNREKAEDEIHDLKRRGEIIEPTQGFLRAI